MCQQDFYSKDGPEDLKVCPREAHSDTDDPDPEPGLEGPLAKVTDVKQYFHSTDIKKLSKSRNITIYK